MSSPSPASPIIERFRAAQGTLRALSTRGHVLEFTLFLGSTTVFQVTRLVVNLAAAAVLLPETYGIWGLVLVILTYTQQGSLGIINGANRQIPILLGQGNRESAVRIERVSLGAGTLAGVVMAVLVGAAVQPAGSTWRVIAIPLALAILLQQLYSFYQMSLRARLDFNQASVQQFVQAILVGAVGLPLLAWAGIQGLVASQVIAFGVGAAIVALVWRRNIRPQWDARKTLELMRDGLPIMMNGLIFGALTTTDRWVILAVASAQTLGHYTLAATLASGLLFVSGIIGQQFYPRMAMAYGRARDARPLWRIALLQCALAGAMVAPVALVLVLGAPFVIPAFFPKYASAVMPMQLLTLDYFVLVIGGGFTNLLVTTGRSWQIVLLQLPIIVIDVLLSTLALRAGFGPTGVALANLAGYSLMMAGAGWLAWRATHC